jgi:ferric-dicitrate binding protein FerR (iron transport regulator)
MNDSDFEDDHDEGATDVEVLHVQNVLRGTPAPSPDAAYRARVKEAFRIGAIEHPAEGPAEHVAKPGVIVPLPRRRQSALWTGAAVAAAILVALLTGVLNRGPEWTIVAVHGDCDIRLDGVPLALADASTVGRRIEPGIQIEVPPDAEVHLRAGGVIAMQLTGGTELTVPPTPPRWFGRRAELYARAGEIRVTTGRAFRGARLDVFTPDAAVEVTGTTFAVILEPTGTCVCVLDGTVHVGHKGKVAMTAVPSGRRRYVFRDGREAHEDSMRDMERAKLAMFRESEQAAMGGARPE